VKNKAWQMKQDGHKLTEISETLGVNINTMKRWYSQWKREREQYAEKAKREIMAKTETQVSIESHTLDHLLALREQYNALKEQIMSFPPNTPPEKLVPLFRELRETIMASAKLEGVEPPEKHTNFNINAKTKMTFEEIMASLREIKDEQDERL
jgi:transposase-like protein